jgi:hypothetical protein
MHEMDMDMAFVLVVLKRLLAQHPKLKLILMSATVRKQLSSCVFIVSIPSLSWQMVVSPDENSKDAVFLRRPTPPRWRDILIRTR